VSKQAFEIRYATKSRFYINGIADDKHVVDRSRVGRFPAERVLETQSVSAAYSMVRRFKAQL